MKKILKNLWGGTALTALVAGGVFQLAGCKHEFTRFQNASLADNIKKYILATLKKNAKYANFTFHDLFKDEDLTKLVVRLINERTSDYFFRGMYAQRLVWAGGLSEHPAQDIANLKKVFYHWVLNLSIDKLYTEYLKGFLDYSLLEWVSVQKNEEVIFDNKSDHHQGLRWVWSDIKYVDQNHQMISYQSIDSKYKMTRQDVKAIVTDQTKIAQLKTELAYSFRPYLMHQIVPQVLDEIITAVYLNATSMLSYAEDQTHNHVYIDHSSALFGSMMKWNNLIPTGSDIKSNFWMLWEYKVKKEYASQINTKISQQQNYSNPKPQGLFTGEEWAPVAYNNFIQNQLLKTVDGDEIENSNKDGVDPVFGIPHFKGFVAYDDDAKIVNGFEAGVYDASLKTAQKAGFLLSNGAGNYNFNKTPEDTYVTFAYALPIYVPDLLAQQDKTAALNFYDQDHQKSLHEVIELKSYNNPGAIEDYSWAGLGGFKGRSVKYLREQKPATKAATFGTYASDGTTAMYQDGLPNKDVDFTNFDLVNWASYMYGKNETLAERAKHEYYSVVFDYDAENVYSQALYDQIGKYIDEY